jgi:acetyltransferase
MIAQADEHTYRDSLTLLLQDKEIDAVIVIFVHPITVDAREVAMAIVDVHSKYPEKPVLCCFMGRDTEGSGIDELRRHHLPVYLFPESAALSLSAMVRYRKIKDQPLGEEVKFDDIDQTAADKIMKEAVSNGREWMTESEVQGLLAAYKIPFERAHKAKTVTEALEVAEKVGYPVVLKAISPDLIHKTDMGGVHVDIRSASELRKVFKDMKERLKGFKNLNFMLQKMIKGGRETVMGMVTDPIFGPLVMFGLGGIFVEVLKDVSFRVLPLTDRDANQMIQQLRGAKFLTGFRGEPPVAGEKLVEALLRMSQMIGDYDHIREMDINPFLAFPDAKDCVAVDARIALRENGAN